MLVGKCFICKNLRVRTITHNKFLIKTILVFTTFVATGVVIQLIGPRNYLYDYNEQYMKILQNWCQDL